MSTTATPKPNRQIRRKQETRCKLLKAANEVFLAKGVEDTTASDISDAADVAYGTFYNYFNSVTELVPVVVEEVLREHHLKVRELQSKYDDPAMRVAIGINTLFGRVMSDPAIKWLTQKPDIMAQELYRVVSDDAMDDIRQGVESGDFTLPCDYETLQAFCIWGVTGVLQEVARAPEKLNSMTDNLIQTYLRILGIDDEKSREVVKYCPSLAS